MEVRKTLNKIYVEGELALCTKNDGIILYEHPDKVCLWIPFPASHQLSPGDIVKGFGRLIYQSFEGYNWYFVTSLASPALKTFTLPPRDSIITSFIHRRVCPDMLFPMMIERFKECKEIPPNLFNLYTEYWSSSHYKICSSCKLVASVFNLKDLPFEDIIDLSGNIMYINEEDCAIMSEKQKAVIWFPASILRKGRKEPNNINASGTLLYYTKEGHSWYKATKVWFSGTRKPKQEIAWSPTRFSWEMRRVWEKTCVRTFFENADPIIANNCCVCDTCHLVKNALTKVFKEVLKKSAPVAPTFPSLRQINVGESSKPNDGTYDQQSSEIKDGNTVNSGGELIMLTANDGIAKSEKKKCILWFPSPYSYNLYPSCPVQACGRLIYKSETFYSWYIATDLIAPQKANVNPPPDSSDIMSLINKRVCAKVLFEIMNEKIKTNAPIDRNLCASSTEQLLDSHFQLCLACKLLSDIRKLKRPNKLYLTGRVMVIDKNDYVIISKRRKAIMWFPALYINNEPIQVGTSVNSCGTLIYDTPDSYAWYTAVKVWIQNSAMPTNDNIIWTPTQFAIKLKKTWEETCARSLFEWYNQEATISVSKGVKCVCETCQLVKELLLKVFKDQPKKSMIQPSTNQTEDRLPTPSGSASTASTWETASSASTSSTWASRLSLKSAASDETECPIEKSDSSPLYYNAFADAVLQKLKAAESYRNSIDVIGVTAPADDGPSGFCLKSVLKICGVPYHIQEEVERLIVEAYSKEEVTNYVHKIFAQKP